MWEIRVDGGGASAEPELEAPSGGPYPCTSEGYDALCKSEYGSEAYYNADKNNCYYPSRSSSPDCEGEFDSREVFCSLEKAQLGIGGVGCW